MIFNAKIGSKVTAMERGGLEILGFCLVVEVHQEGLKGMLPTGLPRLFCSIIYKQWQCSVSDNLFSWKTNTRYSYLLTF